MKKKANKRVQTNVLLVDALDQHLDDDTVFTIHPKKINFLSNVEKESFDKVVIKNTTASSLKSIYFFFLGKVLKPNSLLEVYIYQPISVMQSLDASEIEANAKLAGFVDIQMHEIEFFTKEGEKDIKVKSTKLSMVRPEKVTEKK